MRMRVTVRMGDQGGIKLHASPNTIYAFAEAAEAAERMWLAERLLLGYALF